MQKFNQEKIKVLLSDRRLPKTNKDVIEGQKFNQEDIKKISKNKGLTDKQSGFSKKQMFN